MDVHTAAQTFTGPLWADTHTWWYIARSAGLVAWGLTAAAVLWGLALSGKPFGRRPARGWLYDLHEHLGALAVVFTGVHVVALVADTTVTFTLIDVLVPFAASWRPAAVAAGVVAAWLLLAVQLTSVARRRLPTRLWRLTHRASLPLWALATVHLLTAGHDARAPALLAVVVATTAAVAFLATYRLVSRRTRPEAGSRPAGSSRSQARTPATRPGRHVPADATSQSVRTSAPS